jgi:thiol-disulfide isomerase/thioredoxin
MMRVWGAYVCLALLVGVSVLLWATPLAGSVKEATADARELLLKAQAAFQGLPPVACEGEATCILKRESGEFWTYQTRERFRQKGDQVDISYTESHTHGQGDQEEKLGTLDVRNIWDGSMFLHRQRSVELGPEHLAYFTRDQSYRDRIRQRDSKLSWLDGFLPYDSHFAETMLKAEQLQVRPTMEDVNGIPCHVIEASGPGGRFRAWIDPAHGYNFRRLTASKTWDDPRKSGDRVELTIDATKLEQVEGIWLVVSLKARQQEVYKGQRYETRRTISRSGIKWNPDFEALGAFRMDLPEGARIKDEDHADSRCIWHNGRPERLSEMQARLYEQPAPPRRVEQWYNAGAAPPDLKGKVVVLDFFGVWCGPCMAKIPLFREIWNRYASQGVVVVGVHTPKEKEGIPQFIADQSVRYPIAVDRAGQTAAAYHVYYYPTVVIVDRKGLVRAINPPEDRLDTLLQSLAKETPE